MNQERVNRPWTPAPNEAEERVVLDVGQADAHGMRKQFDLTPFTRAIKDVIRAERTILANPYDKHAFGLVVGAAKAMRHFVAQPMPEEVGRVVRHVAHHMAGPMMEHARLSLQLRMHAEHKLIMHPTQTVGLTFSAPTGGTATVTIQNPYQGSGAQTVFRNTLWAITALESGALANTATATGSLFLTSAIWAGHDYVQASRQAVVTGSVSGTGGGTILNGPTNSGWGWYIFASDKRERPHTTFSPWNVQGAGGIVGAIMRETGQVTFTFLNQTGGTVVVPFHVHMKASLCGGPFEPAELIRMFVPFHKQLSAAHSMAQWLPDHFEGAFNEMGHNVKQIQGLEEGLELNPQLFMPT